MTFWVERFHQNGGEVRVGGKAWNNIRNMKIFAKYLLLESDSYYFPYLINT